MGRWTEKPVLGDEIREKIRKSLLGRKLSEQHKKHISERMKGRIFSIETKDKIRQSLLKRKSILGYINTPETRKKMSLAKKGHIPWNKGISFNKTLGKNHWNWQGGKSFEPYVLGWNKTFKEQIRFRDKYKCQICGVSEAECLKTLAVHHIDYNKKNLNTNNLISLCFTCHAKTNRNRNYWIEYFRSKQYV